MVIAPLVTRRERVSTKNGVQRNLDIIMLSLTRKHFLKDYDTASVFHRCYCKQLISILSVEH